MQSASCFEAGIDSLIVFDAA